MGGIATIIRRLIRSVTPLATRANGGVYYEVLPRGGAITAAAAITLTGGGANAYGNTVSAISATANTADAWALGVVLSAPSVAKKYYQVCVSSQAAGAVAANSILGEVIWENPQATGTSIASEWIPFPEPVYLPANAAISLGVASSTGGGTVNARVVVSRNK